MKKFIIMLAAIIFAGTLLLSCNVTRRTTVESSYHQNGDTIVQITTKTIETYDAEKKGF